MTLFRKALALGIGATLATSVACTRKVSNQVTPDGTVELTQVDVAPFVSGRVVRVTVDEGAVVRRGDTLVAFAIVLIAFSVRRFQKNIE